MLVQDQIDTLIRDMIKGLTAAANDHRLENGNIRLKDLLEKRVAEARANSTNRTWVFITLSCDILR